MDGTWDLTMKDLAAALPDLPRWVETRGLLLSGRCKVFGFSEGGADYAVRSTDSPMVCIVGRPDADAIKAASRNLPSHAEMVVQRDSADQVSQLLKGWRPRPATIHSLSGRPLKAPSRETAGIRLLTVRDNPTLVDLPIELNRELLRAIRYSVAAAVFVDGMPLSFCYAGEQTETLWDVSIDTIERQRRRGLAAACVTFLVKHMRGLGKEPVWGSRDDNEASMNLAAKLGFKPLDRLMVFSRR